MKEIFLIATIAGLFGLGLLIVLQSGVADPKKDGRLGGLAANLSAVSVRLVGLLAGAEAVQRLIGSPSLFLNW
jgi:hypothetical protein